MGMRIRHKLFFENFFPFWISGHKKCHPKKKYVFPLFSHVNSHIRADRLQGCFNAHTPQENRNFAHVGCAALSVCVILHVSNINIKIPS